MREALAIHLERGGVRVANIHPKRGGKRERKAAPNPNAVTSSVDGDA